MANFSVLDETGISPVVVHVPDTAGTVATTAAVAIENLRQGPATVYGLVIDNTKAGTSSTAVHVKLFDGTAVTVGTTAPDYIIHAPANTKQFFPLNGQNGETFSNGLSVVTTAASALAATTPVATQVPVTFLVAA